MAQEFRVRPRTVRTARRPEVIRVERATFIPTGMHGVREAQEEGWRAATMIPTGMHAAVIFDKAAELGAVVEKLVAQGVPPGQARVLVQRAAMRQYRNRGSGLGGLGDVIADGTTWITYGNDVIARSKSTNVANEAIKTAQNISTFLGNRGDELQAASPDTVDALDEMFDKLSKIGVGTMKYDSVSGAFVDEFGNAIRGEVIVGARAVAAAPGKLVKYAVDEVIKPALDVVPWYVWAGGTAAGVAILTKALKIW